MSRWLVLLLVVCLPLKALALTGAFVCLHHHAAATAVHEPASPAPASHEHCEGHDAAASGNPEASGASDPSSGAPHACSSCAPCSAAAAPAPDLADIGPAAWPPAYAVQPERLVLGIVPGVPHRPPR
jgi:hypothetical protein